MRAAVFVLLACLAGYAAAGGKQISVPSPLPPSPSPSPSPPPVGPTYETEGFVFSFIVPGYNPLTFNADKQKALCAEITSADPTALPKAVTFECSIESVSSFNNTNVIASGFAYAKWSTVPSAQDVAVLVALRDAWIKALTNQPAAIFKAFPGTVANCACSGLASVTKPSTSPYTYTTTVLAQGPMQCDSRLTYPGNTVAQSNPNGIINQVGVDDGTIVAGNRGKFCSNPAVEGGVLGQPGVGSCITYGVVAQPAGSQQASVDNGLVGINNGATVVPAPFPTAIPGAGYYTVPKVTVSAPNPTPAIFTWNLDINGTPLGGIGNLDIDAAGYARNGPYTAGTKVTLSFLEDVCVDVGLDPLVTFAPTQEYACTGPIKTITFGSFVWTGRVCTASDFNNGVGGCAGGYPAAPITGACALMSNAPAGLPDNTNNNFLNQVTFPGWTPRCSKQPTTVVSSANLQTAVVATATAKIDASAGTVTQVDLTSAGSGYRTPATFTIAPPDANNQIGKLCSAQPISGLSLDIALPNPIAGGVTVDGQCQPIGRDTVANKPCSIPSVAGGLWAPLDAFTCNVASSFRSQPNAPNAIAACAVLPQRVVIPVPGPGPSPSPSPSPSVSPSPPPSPVAPTSCTYQGVFRLESVACSGKFLAYTINGSSDTCKNTNVLLRSAKQSASPRRNWILNTVAEEGKVVNGSSVQAAGRIPRCPGTGIINLASANSSPTPRLAGSSWKLRVAPVSFSDCSVVTLQATGGTYANKFLGVNPASCSNQKGFNWEASAAAAAAHWKAKRA